MGVPAFPRPSGATPHLRKHSQGSVRSGGLHSGPFSLVPPGRTFCRDGLMNRYLTLLFLLCWCSAAVGKAQEVIQVNAKDIQQHIDHQVPPVYPPIAKAVRIQGTVVFDITVGVSGNIESIKVVSGPPMLQQAALDCLKQWTYHPFEKDGLKVAASGQTSIEFMLSDGGPTAEEDNIAARYFPLADQCRKAMPTRDYATASSLCRQAAETAGEFEAGVRFIEKRSAYVYAAWAFLYSSDLQNGLIYATKAVEVVTLGHDDNSGSSAAYGIKGILEGRLGNLDAADSDLSTAEDFQRKEITWAEKEAPSLKREYSSALIMDLNFHAQVLQALNRPDDAQKKLDEAAKYN